MTAVQQLLRQAERQLVGAGIGDARLEAELVWMTALEVDRTHLFSQLGHHPGESTVSLARGLLTRRLRHEPAAYLMGHKEFYGLDFLMAPGVLIPRPETEGVVEEAIWILHHSLRAQERPTIADVGTGSGVIAVSLAACLPQAMVYATDTSQPALELAALNAERHGVADRIHFLEGDLLGPLPGPVDLVAANLPYVRSDEIPYLDPEIRLYEPYGALDGGEDGLEVIGRLLESAPAHLNPGGSLVLELDPRQMERATKLAHAAFPSATARQVTDLSGRPRVLSLQLPD